MHSKVVLQPLRNVGWTLYVRTILVEPTLGRIFLLQFRNGRWYAMEKFDTSSKCLTYDFTGEADGEMFVEQRSTLTGLARLSFDNKAIYKGRLVAPKSTDPANMIVRFPLSELTYFCTGMSEITHTWTNPVWLWIG